MDNVISAEEKQQILNKMNKWFTTVYPYKKPPSYLCDPIDIASVFPY